LGYLKLGQPINTLSGGESQRLKLVKHLAESLPPEPVISDSAAVGPGEHSQQPVGAVVPEASSNAAPTAARPRCERGTTRCGPEVVSNPALFLFDEPTTGLHFDDVRVLLKVFQRLVDAGHSVIVIEHNLEVIKSADWIIDLGPEAGDQGGRLVAQGTPEQVAETPGSFTGQALRAVLARGVRQPFRSE
jgi:excinuclease ABC subunit A